jgi:integrase
MSGPRLWKRYNGVYYIILPGDRRISLQTRNKEEAKRQFNAYRKRWLAGKIRLLDGAKNIRLGAFVAEYLESRQGKSYSTARNDRLALGKLVSHFGPDRTLRSISTRELEQFKAGLRKGISAVSVNTYFRHLRGAFATALRWEYTTKDPIKPIRFDAEPERIPDLVVEDILRAILAHADEQERRYILVSLYTAMRPFELIKLTYGDIVGGVIRLQGKQRKARFVPVFGECAKLIGVGKPDEHVFKRWRTPSGVSHMFRRFANKAGYEYIRLYDLRDTAATVMTMTGMDPTTVEKVMGHTDRRTTSRYIHVTVKHMERFMEEARKFYDNSMTEGLNEPINLGELRANKPRTNDS